MKKIALCGSAKNHVFITKLADALTDKGFYIFLFPDARSLFQDILPQQTKIIMAAGLTHDHFGKIKNADYILFANLGRFIGNSATMELGCAAGLSKHIIALNHDEELARECLFHDVLETEDINEIADIFAKKFK
ncbi:MAG: hypothetical protein LBK26_00470 [Rickettsiales bacterium]|jgi:nucleoside 2-deoxyribosyltransferase|nr:hypothetical protein [Rickettsiales bacterium]